MSVSTVTSKGQVTIPAQVRKELGLYAGSRIDFVRLDDGRYEMVPATDTVRALKGFISAPADAVTLEGMDEAIADAAAESSQ